MWLALFVLNICAHQIPGSASVLCTCCPNTFRTFCLISGANCSHCIPFPHHPCQLKVQRLDLSNCVFHFFACICCLLSLCFYILLGSDLHVSDILGVLKLLATNNVLAINIACFQCARCILILPVLFLVGILNFRSFDSSILRHAPCSSL